MLGYIIGLLISTCGLAWVAILVAWLRIRRLRERDVVQTLAALVGQNLPLVAGLQAAAEQERGALRRIFRDLAERLEAGAALSTALGCALVNCSGWVVGAVRGAERGGTLPSILRLLASEKRDTRVNQAGFTPALPYFALLLLIYPAITLAIITFLVPKFRDVFLDFGVPSLPPITEKLIRVLGLANDHPVLSMAALAAIVLTVAQVVIGRNFWARKPDLFQWPFVLLDSLSWHLPLGRRVAQVRALARQLPIMQAAVRAGEDLPEAARQAACVDANHYSRCRLRRWADAIEQGGDPVDAARRSRLPKPLIRALVAARGGRELPAVLDYLSSYYRSLSVHWDHVAASVIVPTLMLLFGMCFGYVVVAFYMPLQYLLDSVMAEMY